MTAKVFVDTNVLIYAHDSDAGSKYAVASQMIEELWTSHLGVVSTQVLQEFYVNITTKIPKPLPKAEAATHVARYFVWPVIRPSTATIQKAFEIETRHRLSFWDALIVSAALQAGVSTILSEDFNAGQKINGITVVNPFSIGLRSPGKM